MKTLGRVWFVIAFAIARFRQWWTKLAQKLNEPRRVEIDEAMLAKADEPLDYPIIKTDFANKSWMRGEK